MSGCIFIPCFGTQWILLFGLHVRAMGRQLLMQSLHAPQLYMAQALSTYGCPDRTDVANQRLLGTIFVEFSSLATKAFCQAGSEGKTICDVNDCKMSLTMSILKQKPMNASAEVKKSH